MYLQSNVTAPTLRLLCPILLTWISIGPRMTINNNLNHKVFNKITFILKLQRGSYRSSAMDGLFHSKIIWECDYLSMLLIHCFKVTWLEVHTMIWNICPSIQFPRMYMGNIWITYLYIYVYKNAYIFTVGHARPCHNKWINSEWIHS